MFLGKLHVPRGGTQKMAFPLNCQSGCSYIKWDANWPAVVWGGFSHLRLTDLLTELLTIYSCYCLSVCLSLTEIYQIRLDGRAEGNGIGFSLIKRPLSYINQSIVTFQALCFESPSSLRLSVTTLSLSLFLLALHISKEKTRGAC